MRDIVIFQFRKDMPVEKLLLYHRWMRWIIYPCGFFMVTMFSSMGELFIVGPDSKTASIIVIIFVVSVTGVVILLIPALFLTLWMRDVEKELLRRSIPIPGGVEIDERMTKLGRRVIGWTLFLILVGWLHALFT